MARFYQTGLTDFTEYDTTRPGAVSTESVFGKLEALPEDRARLQEIVSGYDEQINQLADQLRRNPKAVQQLQPQIGQLRGSLRDQLQYGEIAAIQDRLKQYRDVEGGVRKTLADDPFLADQAIKRIQVNPLGFDPSTRQYGKIDAPDVVKPFGAEDKRKWRESAENVIKDRILGKVQDTTKLNATKSLLEVGETVGVTPEQVTEALLGQVTPEMIRSEQQALRLRGMDKEADREANFYDPATGEFDKSTTYGAMLSSMVAALARTNFKGNRLQVTDDATKAAIDANKQLKVARGKSRIDKKEQGKIIADKIQAVYRGEDATFERVEQDDNQTSPTRADNWLQGEKTDDGNIILGIEKNFGEKPVVIIQKYKGDKPQVDPITRKPEVEKRPLDMEFLQTHFGQGVTDAVKEELGENYDQESASVSIDYTQDAPKSPGDQRSVVGPLNRGNTRGTTPGQPIQRKVPPGIKLD